MKLVLFTFLLAFICNTTFAQTEVYKYSDIQLKEVLCKKYKKEVLSFDKNDFDTLFFEFFQKQKDEDTTLSKEEFYTYTIKIAIYSEKLGLLHKEQKVESQRTKQEWFDKNYQDYLNSKTIK